jgi:hypothetical protein
MTNPVNVIWRKGAKVVNRLSLEKKKPKAAESAGTFVMIPLSSIPSVYVLQETTNIQNELLILATVILSKRRNDETWKQT